MMNRESLLRILRIEKQKDLTVLTQAVPRSLNRAIDSFFEQTGWCGTFIVGGPQPQKGGALACYVFHRGQTFEFRNKWPRTDERYQENVIESYKHFLQLAYSPEHRKTFALKRNEDSNLNLGGEVTIIDDNGIGKGNDQPSVDCEAAQDQVSANEPAKRSTRKKRARLANLNEDSTDEDGIKMSGSEDDEDKEEANEEAVDIPPCPIRQTPEEKKREANIRRNKALFRLQSVYENEPDKLAKIDQAFYSFEVDVDDMDVANTILARAGLPSMDALAPDPLAELDAIRKLMEEEAATHKTKKLDPPARPKNPPRKVHFSDPLETGPASSRASYISTTGETPDEPASEIVTAITDPSPTAVDCRANSSETPVDLSCSIVDGGPDTPGQTILDPVPILVDTSPIGLSVAQHNNHESHSALPALVDSQEVEKNGTCDSVTQDVVKQKAGSGKGARGRCRKKRCTSDPDIADKENMTNSLLCSMTSSEDLLVVETPAPQNHELGGMQPAVKPDCPEWVDRVVHELRMIWSSTKWKALLEAWKAFELSGHGDQERALPLSKAPVEIHSALQLIEAPVEDFEFPYVHSGPSFSAIWWNWWLSCQSKWRIAENVKSGGPPKLKTDISKINTLQDLCYGGKKGLMLVVLSLALWIHAVEHSQQSSKSLAAAMADVSWVLKTLEASEHNSFTEMDIGKKRSAEVSTTRARKKSRSS
ncbi:hypothetical protein ACEPAF_282 [Sanghuangporus sanghuang]